MTSAVASANPLMLKRGKASILTWRSMVGNHGSQKQLAFPFFGLHLWNKRKEYVSRSGLFQVPSSIMITLGVCMDQLTTCSVR